MKKLFFISIVLFVFITNSFACEICGCGVGNFYLGILPAFKTKFIGVRYSYQHYYSEMATDHSQFSNDFYKTAEIWGGWNLGNRWQLMVFVPYRFNKKTSDDGVKETNGLGDITLLLNYSLLHTRKVRLNNTVIENQLWIGGGAKLANGVYHIDLTDPSANIGDVNSQLGTGSTAFILSAMHTINIRKFGVTSSVNYSINTTNADRYRFGNRVMVNSLAYYRLRVAGVSVSPNLGLLYQHSAINHYQNDPVEQSGGYTFNASGGVEVSLNKITVGLNAQIPIKQNFADGQTNARSKGVLHISFAL